MIFPTEQLCLYVVTRYKAGATVNDTILEMTQVHGKEKVLSQKTVYRWIKDIQNGCFELTKGKSPGHPRSTRTQEITCSPPDFR